jgi:DNA-binding NarL/FixJ family response regulator
MVADRLPILLVDDDPAFVRAITPLLSQHAPLRIAETGAQAIAMVAEVAPLRAAIVDLCLPDGHDGVAVLEELRRVQPGTPALLISGNLDLRPANLAYLAGAACLEKPFGFDCIERFLASTCPFESTIASVARTWRDRYSLTPAQEDVLRRLALGENRDLIAMARSCSPATIKRHVFDLLQKTTDESAHAAVMRMMNERTNGALRQ